VAEVEVVVVAELPLQVGVLVLQAVADAPELAEQVGALDRHCRLVGEDRLERELLRVERAPAQHADDAEQLTAEDERVGGRGDGADLVADWLAAEVGRRTAVAERRRAGGVGIR
jgi:hypothetical protein